MGRPKKIKETEQVAEEIVDLAKLKEELVERQVLRNVPPISLRNDYGLYEHIDYKFTKFGFVDWKAMISPEHIVLNRENFLRKDSPIDISSLSEEELNILKEKADEKDKLIKLSGYRELAQIRGYSSISTECKFVPEIKAIQATCFIDWVPNYEQNYKEVRTCGVADASYDNTSFDMSKYLSCIAENRAFVRAVRNFLQINIAGQDELKSETVEDFAAKNQASLTLSGPQGALDKKLKDKKRGFNELVQFALSKYPDKVMGADLWNSVRDMQSSDATFLLGKFEEFLSRE